MSLAARGEREAPDGVSELPTISVSSTFHQNKTNSDCVLDVCVDGVPAGCLVDTGAVMTILSKRIWKKLSPEKRKLDPLEFQCNLVDAQGTPLKLDGRAQVKLQLGSQQFPAHVLVAEGLSVDLILGRDFLKKHQCSIELGEKDHLCLNRAGVTLPVGISDESRQRTSVAVIANESVCIPPLSEMEILATVPATAEKGTWLVESTLPEKMKKFEWTNDCQEAFDNLRQKLVSAPILAFPDYTKSFILDTDASDTGMGAVLSQVESGGTERVIAYASCTLSQAERRYCVTRKELLAVVTFIKHFRPYLLGRHFTLRTDHGSLTWLARFKESEGQLARWLEKLQEYDFSILHRPGKRHQNADALSRLPCRQCGRGSHSSPEVSYPKTLDKVTGAISQPQTIQLQERSSTELRNLQLQDLSVGFVLRAKEKGERPTSQQVKGMSIAVRRLCQLWDRLKCQDGQLWRFYNDGTGQKEWLQLVIPVSLREEILHEVHQGVISGHLGEQKMLYQLKERFYWPGMAEDVHNWCQTCAPCATNKSPSTQNCAPLKTITAGHPMQVIAVDITGPFPESEAGNRYVLVVGDYFTRWMECFALPDQEAG